MKAELRGQRWPRTSEEGFRQAIGLMAIAFITLTSEIQTKMPKASKSELQEAIFKELARLGRVDARWVYRWKIERARYF